MSQPWNVGEFVGEFVGELVGEFVGEFVGDFVGEFVGEFVGGGVLLMQVVVELHAPSTHLFAYSMMSMLSMATSAL